MPEVYQYPFGTRLKARIFRVISLKRFSAPYLSQDFFRSLADYSIETFDDFLAAGKLKRTGMTSLYVNSSILLPFLQSHKVPDSVRVILSGSSDYEFHDPIQHLLPESLSKMFLQNSFVSDNDRIFTLPIGIENLSLGLNGFPRLLRPRERKLNDRLLVGPFSETHSSRKTLLNLPFSKTSAYVARERLSPGKYAKLVKGFTFVACPPGQGADTHRFWETIYRGSIPIVLASKWSHSLRRYKIPFLEVSKWEDEVISRAIEGFRLAFTPSRLPAIWDKYWLAEIESVLQKSQ